MSKLPFVYLTSTPFSGSTLFSFLANTHPNLVTVGEMTGLVKSSDPDSYICSCTQRIRNCSFWQRVASGMTVRGFPFDPGFFDTRIRLGNGPFAQRVLSGSMGSIALEDIRDHVLRALPPYRKRLQYLMARNKALAASILEVSGKSVFFDASKSAESIRHFSREQDLDLRVVHLVRDVRGFSLSRHKNKGETDLRLIVNKWIHANSNIERQLRRLPADRWIRVRYEDVCDAPLETMNRFFAFCGLAPLDATGAVFPAAHHIVGNRMRLTNFGVVRLDEAWRCTLTPDQQSYIASLAGEMHATYGYKPMDNSDLIRESI